jgi:subtilisin family serine protease
MSRLLGGRFGDASAAARLGLDRTFVLEVPEGSDTAAIAADFAALEEDVEFAEVDAIGTVATGLVPDDQQFRLQYAMHNRGQTGGVADADIDAPEAWKLHTGDLGTVTVAILDTGVTPHTNPDEDEFEGRMVPGMNTDDPDTNLCDGGERNEMICCPGRGLCSLGFCRGGDHDGQECCPNGTCDPFTSDHCYPTHGTHVAGIVAAEGNNGVGVAGVTWGANIMPVRVMGTPDPCRGEESAAASGIIWAVDNGADIINVSLQYYYGGPTFEDAVDYAYVRGVLVVSAAGNSSAAPCVPRPVAAPARFANSMAVSATTDEDLIANCASTGGFWSSNIGDEIDVCAPGHSIYSTYSIGYGYLSGTSMAAPHVAGLAALLKSDVPGLTPSELREIITKTADYLGTAEEGWDREYGYGRINARNALLGTGETRIVASAPHLDAIDARQPWKPDGSDPTGWQWVDLLIMGKVSDLTADDFDVTADPPCSAPFVIAVQPLEGEFNWRVVLSWEICVDAWTTITYVGHDSSTRLGYFPGDVDGNGTRDGADVATLVDAVSGVLHPPLPLSSTDIDRSGRLAPADILREIDLLNGAEEYWVLEDPTLP